MKRYVIGLVVTAASSAFAFIFVLLFLNPNKSQPAGTILLFTSLFFFVASITTLLGFVIRVWRSRNEIIFAHLGTSFRQGLLLAVVLVGSLVLQLFGIFNIWSGLLFVVAVILVELAFQSQSGTALLNSKRQPETKKGPTVTDVVRKNSPEPLKTRITQDQ